MPLIHSDSSIFLIVYLAFSLAFFLTFCLTYYPANILANILAGILSGTFPRLWHVLGSRRASLHPELATEKERRTASRHTCGTLSIHNLLQQPVEQSAYTPQHCCTTFFGAPRTEKLQAFSDESDEYKIVSPLGGFLQARQAKCPVAQTGVSGW